MNHWIYIQARQYVRTVNEFLICRRRSSAYIRIVVASILWRCPKCRSRASDRVLLHALRRLLVGSRVIAFVGRSRDCRWAEPPVKSDSLLDVAFAAEKNWSLLLTLPTTTRPSIVWRPAVDAVGHSPFSRCASLHPDTSVAVGVGSQRTCWRNCFARREDAQSDAAAADDAASDGTVTPSSNNWTNRSTRSNAAEAHASHGGRWNGRHG